MPRILDSFFLHCYAGSSDKVFVGVLLEEGSASYTVHTWWGKRGRNPQHRSYAYTGVYGARAFFSEKYDDKAKDYDRRQPQECGIFQMAAFMGSGPTATLLLSAANHPGRAVDVTASYQPITGRAAPTASPTAPVRPVPTPSPRSITPDRPFPTTTPRSTSRATVGGHLPATPNAAVPTILHEIDTDDLGVL